MIIKEKKKEEKFTKKNSDTISKTTINKNNFLDSFNEKLEISQNIKINLPQSKNKKKVNFQNENEIKNAENNLKIRNFIMKDLSCILEVV